MSTLSASAVPPLSLPFTPYVKGPFPPVFDSSELVAFFYGPHRPSIRCFRPTQLLLAFLLNEFHTALIELRRTPIVRSGRTTLFVFPIIEVRGDFLLAPPFLLRCGPAFWLLLLQSELNSLPVHQVENLEFGFFSVLPTRSVAHSFFLFRCLRR